MAEMIAVLPYVYSATIHRWVDGDTVWLDVDLGFKTRLMMDVRLLGINTPERGQKGWAEATARVKELAPEGTAVVIQTRRTTEKYGRWLADIWVHGTGQHINSIMVAEGLAVPFMVER